MNDKNRYEAIAFCAIKMTEIDTFTEDGVNELARFTAAICALSGLLLSVPIAKQNIEHVIEESLK